MDEIKMLSQHNKIPISALCRDLSLPRATYYRKNQINKKSIETKPPANALPDETKQIILDLLHSERFTDDTAYQAYYTLLDEGIYHASIRTFYRLLAKNHETIDRRDQRHHRDAIKPELMADAKNQVWSWDITKLLTTRRLTYYHLYVMIDIFSRYVVGWLVADRECQFLAEKLMQETILKYDIQPGTLTIHSDNGPSMKSLTVAELLESMGVSKTHNRPYTSNDNPFSESHFKTLKYCPEFPKKFDSIEEAEKFCHTFFTWYNQQHYHSGILWLTPEQVHYDKADDVLKNRHQVLYQAYLDNPGRFNNREPKLKKLKPVYINPPQFILIPKNLQTGEIMV